MQITNQNKRSQEELIQIANIIFPGSYNVYSSEFDKLVQYIELNEVNRIPYYLLENKDKSINNYILYFHGNGENIEDSFYMVSDIAQYLKAHFILVEYPGYGVYDNIKDALIVFDHIIQKFTLNDNQIYVFGRSIGTGPAFYLGTHRNCAGLIILSAYITLYKLVEDIIPKKAKYLLNENNMNNQENSQKIKCKCLFIHGKQDTLTFLEPIQDLYNKLPPNIKEGSYLSIQDNMTHNSFQIKTNIVDPILNFYPELKINKDEQDKKLKNEQCLND